MGLISSQLNVDKFLALPTNYATRFNRNTPIDAYMCLKVKVVYSSIVVRFLYFNDEVTALIYLDIFNQF